MTTPVNFVQNATYTFAPETVRVPIFIWTVFSALNKVHATWRWYRRLNLYTQQQSMTQLFAGHLINNVIEDSRLLRIAAQTLLIATRILDCVQAQQDLYEAYDAWKRSLTGNYTVSMSIPWRTTTSGIFSPSTLLSWGHFEEMVNERIQRIAMKTFMLGWCMFVLSMKIMDALDAINWSHEARQDAFAESFTNIQKCIDNKVCEKTNILKELEKNKILISHILTATPICYAQLHDGVAKTLAGSEHLQTVYTVISSAKKLIKGWMPDDDF